METQQGVYKNSTFIFESDGSLLLKEPEISGLFVSVKSIMLAMLDAWRVGLAISWDSEK